MLASSGRLLAEYLVLTAASYLLMMQEEGTGTVFEHL